MADARHVIELIIKARDESTAALQSFVANSEAAKRVTEEQSRQDANLARSHGQLSDAKKKLSEEDKKMINERQKLNQLDKESIKRLAELERATTALAKTRQDETRTLAQEREMLIRVEDAQKALTTAISKTDNAANKRSAAQRARNFRDLAESRSQAAEEVRLSEMLMSVAEKNAKEEMQMAQQVRDFRIRMARQRADEEGEIEAEAHDLDKKIFEQRLAMSRQRVDEEEKAAEEEMDLAQKVTAFRLRMSKQRTAEESKEARDRLNLEKDYEKAIVDVARAQNKERQTREAASSTNLPRKQRPLAQQAVIHAVAQTEEAEKKLNQLKKTAKELGLEHIVVEPEARISGFVAQMALAEKAGKGFQDNNQGLIGLGKEIFQSFDQSAKGIAAFDNTIRGIFTLGIAAFLNQILLFAGAAGGAFLALGSSAAYAGAALGGAFVAGAAQAIPVLGVLGTAISRVAGVMKAVQQQNLLNEQAGNKGAQDSRKQASASDALATAQEGLVNAQESVTKANENLARAHDRVGIAQGKVTEARKDAVRQLEDLMLAERGAALSVVEAQRALQQALQEGSTGDIAQARLRVDESLSESSRATEDAGIGRDRGVEGSEGVVAAKQSVDEARRGVKEAQKGIEDAERSVVKARRGIDSARRSASEATEGVNAGASKLNFLLGNLSGAERKMYEAMIRLGRAWRPFAQTISEPLINSFTGAIGKVTGLLSNNKLIDTARGLSSEMGKQFTRAFDAFTSPEILDQFLRIAENGKKNLAPLTDIFINLGKIFLNIAEAGAPALRRIILAVERLTSRWLEFTSSFEGQNKMTKFFETGTSHFFQWIRLLGSIFNIFKAIAGPGGGAAAGLTLLERLTKAFNNFADSAGTGGTKTNKFFKDMFKVMHQSLDALSIIFKALGKELAKTFGDEAASGGASMKGFANIVAKVLIPGFFDFVRVLSRATAAFGRFIENHSGIAKFLATMLAFGLIGGIFTKILGVLGIFVRPIGILVGHFIGLRTVGETLAGVFTRMAVALGLVTKEAAAARAATTGLGVGVGAGAAGKGAAGKGGGYIDPKHGPQSPIIAPVPGAGDAPKAAGKVRGFFRALGPVAKSAGLFHLGFSAISGLTSAFSSPAAYSGRGKARAGLKSFFGSITLGATNSLFGDIDQKINKEIERGIKRAGGEKIKGTLNLEGLVSKDAIRKLDDLNHATAIYRKNGTGLDGLRRKINAIKQEYPGAASAIKRYEDRLTTFSRRVRDKFAEIDFAGAISRAVRANPEKAAEAIKGVLKQMDGLGPEARKRARDAGEAIVKQLERDGVVQADQAEKSIYSIYKKYDQLTAGTARRNARLLKDHNNALNSVMDSYRRSFITSIGDLDKALEGAGLKKVNKGERTLNVLFESFDLEAIIKNRRGQPRTGRKEGGPIGSGYGGGDRVPILAEEGEHVLTKEEVRKAGGHPAIYALRKILGGGLQAAGMKMQQGGRVSGRAGQAEKIAQIDLGDLLSIIRAGGRRMINAWSTIWRTMNRTSFRIMNDMEADAKKSMGKVADHIENGMARGRRGLIRAMNSMGRAIHGGMSYIGSTTNKALKAFDVDPVKFELEKPKAERAATGGIVGNWGERGRDAVQALVGRGEVVLNWGQQSLVNSMIKGQDTLQSIVGRSSGYHAGGPEQPGFAGGFAGRSPSGNPTVAMPGFPGEFIAKKVLSDAMYFIRKFKLMVTDAFATSGHKGAGHLQFGTAMDVVPGAGGSWDTVDRAVAEARKRGLTVLYNGVPNHGRGHHAHIELRAGSGGGADIDSDIPRLKVKGKDPLRKLIQKMIDKVRGAGQSRVDQELETSGDTTPHAYFDADGGSVAKTLYKVWQRLSMPAAALLSAIETGIVESGLRNLPGGDADSVGWRQERGHYGSVAERMNVAHGAQRFYREWRQHADPGESPGEIAAQVQRPAAQYRGRYDAVEGQAKGVIQRLKKFAAGGTVPGPDGEPVPILAHAGEWVLNRTQQMKAAIMAGLSPGRLKAALGFAGGPSSFAGGGEVTETATPKKGEIPWWLKVDTDPEQERHLSRLRLLRGRLRIARALADEAEVKNLQERIKKENTKHKNILKTLEESGKKLVETYKNADPARQRKIALSKGIFVADPFPTQDFDKINKETDNLFKALGRVSKGATATALRKFGHNMEELTREGGLLEQLGNALERRVRDWGIALKNRTFKISKGVHGRKVTRALTEDQVIDQEIYDIETGIQDIGKVQNFISRAIADTGRRIKRIVKRMRDLRKSGGGISKDEREEYGELDKALNTTQATNINLRDRARDLAEKAADAVAALYEKTVEKVRRAIEEAGRGAEITGQLLNTQNARGLGRSGETFSLMDIQINQMHKQFADLQKILGQTTDPQLQREIQDQLHALQASIYEAVANLAREQIEAINDAATQRNTMIDIRERIGNVMTSLIGDVVGGARNALAFLQERGNSLAQQRNDLYGQLGSANATGNPILIQELNNQIAELEAAIAENTLAQRDASTAIQQAMLDVINARAAFRGGVLGSLQQLLGSISNVSGGTTNPQQAELLRQQQTNLEIQRQEQRRKLLAQSGINLLGLSGVDFVNAFNNNLARFEEMMVGMTTSEKEYFQGLLNGIIENESALWANTQAINELTNVSNPQSFSSSMWSMFRNAIFTGAGELLPQYQPPPAMATGGSITKGGLFELHAGEFVIPDGGMKQAPREEHVHMHVENPAPVLVDAQYVSAKLGQELKNKAATR